MELPESKTPEGQLDLDGDDEDLMAEPSRHALAVVRLVEPMREALSAQGLIELNDDLEVPLVRVLARMEQRGIGVDRDALIRIRDELTAETEQSRAAVIEDAGHEFNVNSTKQLREVLFDELGLTPQKKTKTGTAQMLRRWRRSAVNIDRGEPPSFPRGGETTLHIRRRACRPRSGPETGSGQFQPNRGSHRPSQFRRPQPAQHSRSL